MAAPGATRRHAEPPGVTARIRRGKEPTENLATKDDVEHLRGDMEKMEVSLRGELKKAALRTDLEKTEASLRGDMEKLRGDMSTLEHRMTLRLGGAIAAAVAILVAVDKLF